MTSAPERAEGPGEGRSEGSSLARTVAEALGRQRLSDDTTQSGFEVKVVYGPEDVAHLHPQEDIGRPGQYPFTRGTYPQMYREKLWVRGAVPGGVAHIGEGGYTSREAVSALRRLAQVGVITSGMRFGGDYHSLACIDPDHPLVKYDLGRGCGMPQYSPYQWFALDRGTHRHRLARAAFSGEVVWEIGHACGPADVCAYTMILALGEIMGWDASNLRGSAVNDPIHTHITGAMNWKQPLELGFKLAVDMMEYAVHHTPKFRPTNGGCGYDLREAGIDTKQELAFVLASRIAYTDAVLERGITFQEFGHRPPLAFSGEIDFFETICKLRAARRMWARIARDRYGADPRTMKCPPCNTNLAGSSMYPQQPIFNVIRNTIEALASILGGVNGMELKGYAEAETAPPIEASIINTAIEGIIAEETGIPLTADPLGGSYYVEWLTEKIEREATALLQEILDRGGILECIRQGWVQAQVEQAAAERQRELEERRKARVGVNILTGLNEFEIPLPRLPLQPVNPDSGYTRAQERWFQEFQAFKENRDMTAVVNTLRALHRTAAAGQNVIRPMIDAWKARCTIGEIVGVIREGMGFTYDPFNMVQRPAYIEY